MLASNPISFHSSPVHIPRSANASDPPVLVLAHVIYILFELHSLPIEVHRGDLSFSSSFLS